MGGFTISEMMLIEKILLAKTGDKKAMEEVIKSYTPFVVKSARCTFVKGYDIEDLIQIGQVAIIKAVNMFDVTKSSAFTGYVTNAIARSFYGLIRDNIKENSCCSLNSVNEDGDQFIAAIPAEENIEEELLKKEEKLLLRKALDKLPKEDLELINWFYYENKTLEKYAQFKGISYRTAINRKRRVLKRLRLSFKD